MIYSGHQYHLDDLATTVAIATDNLLAHLSEFDFIVVTGVSGTIVGAPVAIALCVPLVVIRKKDDTSHDSQDVVNYGQAIGRYLFLDDFVSAGTTLNYVRDRLAQRLMVGIDSMWKPPEPESPPVYACRYMYDDKQFVTAGMDDPFDD